MANVRPPAGMTRAGSKAQNRQRLLDAAAELLTEFGFSGISARMVSSRAGVAQSSFYAHFADKEALVQTLADALFSSLRQQLRDMRKPDIGMDWEGILVESWGRIAVFYDAQAPLLRLLFQELDQPGSPIGVIGRDIFRILHADFAEDLQHLIQSGAMPPLPVDAVVSMVVGTWVYLLRRALAHELLDPTQTVLEFSRLNRAMVVGLTWESGDGTWVPRNAVVPLNATSELGASGGAGSA